MYSDGIYSTYKRATKEYLVEQNWFTWEKKSFWITINKNNQNRISDPHRRYSWVEKLCVKSMSY